MSEDNPLEETIQEMAHRLVAQAMERYAAERVPPQPTEAETRAALALRETIRDTALAHGALPQSSRFIVHEALELFERGPDGTLIGKGGASEPGNPLKPLSLHSWLLALSADEPWLFVEPQARQ